MNIFKNVLKKLSKETLLKHNAPAKASWLTFWPIIKSDSDRTQVTLPVAPIVLGMIAVAGFIVWYIWKNPVLIKPSVTDADILSVIGQVIELPAETPQVAIVSDKSLLNQAFFEKAENGDYVIVYQQSQKVLLYRPSTKKVINFANVQIPVSQTNTFIQPEN
jgi:hypothetical protein